MSTRSDGSTSAELVTLQADARYARERYQLYKARTYGPRPSDPNRLRKLEQTCLRAEQRLSRAKSGAERAANTSEKELEMSDITEDQVLEAARELGQDEFTRGDVAAKLGVEKPELKKGFRSAIQAGKLEKTRDDEENTGHFRLTG